MERDFLEVVKDVSISEVNSNSWWSDSCGRWSNLAGRQAKPDGPNQCSVPKQVLRDSWRRDLIYFSRKCGGPFLADHLGPILVSHLVVHIRGILAGALVVQMVVHLRTTKVWLPVLGQLYRIYLLRNLNTKANLTKNTGYTRESLGINI